MPVDKSGKERSAAITKNYEIWMQALDTIVGGKINYEKIVHSIFKMDVESSQKAAELFAMKPATPYGYHTHYQIPLGTIADLDDAEKKRRSQLFALGSLIYQRTTGKATFNELEASKVEAKYATAEFPDVTSIPAWPILLSCWSVEFARELQAILGKQAPKGAFDRLTRHIKDHPVLFGFQVAGATVGVASLVAVPVLGAIGFGALGPVAGSAAAGWQTSMGVVEAGSVFAWCQSAAMGGATVNGIIAAGVTGGGVLLGSTAGAALLDGSMNKDEEKKLMALFYRVCRRDNRLTAKL